MPPRPKGSSPSSPSDPSGPDQAIEELGGRIRQLRLEHGWTQAQTAEAASLDLKHLQKIEAGQLNVSFLTLRQLARGFQLSLAELLPHEERPPARRPNPLPAESTDPGTGEAPVRLEDCPSVLAALGNEVARLRKQRGFSQAELAQKAGVGLSTVRLTESGKTNLTVASLVLLANALEVRASALLSASSAPLKRGPLDEARPRQGVDLEGAATTPSEP